MDATVRVEIDADRVATIVFDVPGKSVNTLTRRVWADLSDVLKRLESDLPAGVVVSSGKPRSFIAGADLFEMRAMTRAELESYLLEGQKILARLEALPVPTVACLNGDALGGGLEVALACRFRLAVDEPGPQIGLPETKLGLVPGWGGTVRLVRLIGAQKAIPLMTAGRAVAPSEARELGIVDELVARSELLGAAKEMVLGGAARERTPIAAPSEGYFETAEAEAGKKAGPHVPAPVRLVKVVAEGVLRGAQAGYDAERAALCDLRETEAGKQLMRGFFLRTGAKKVATEGAGADPLPVVRAAVIGGGTMGAGIAAAMVKTGIPVTLVETNAETASRALDRVRKDLGGDESAMSILTTSTSVEDCAPVDLVVEAIIEDIGAKRALFEKLDRVAKPDAILATNTSSLSVNEVAGCTKRPESVVGLHYFNPVAKMPLVEVVRAARSSARTVATAVAVAIRTGKTPILCNDGPGFIVNRVLMPQLAEAMRMVSEGSPVEQIDSAIRAFGMPMGPLALIDTIGLDVIAGIFRAMKPFLGDRVALHPAIDEAVRRDWRGRKSGTGFYHYPAEKGAQPTVNSELVALLCNDGGVSRNESADSIQMRVMLPMVNEAARVLEGRIAANADAIDLATLLGLGFAPFRGGIVAWGDSLGMRNVRDMLRKLADAHGPRFAPAPLIEKCGASELPLSVVTP
jgi:3-hydroxyacyl-CoA dehydrogenase/enoyl-CoA hydratase/3-hydroxybutyryl-CoA epimerase